MQHKLLINGELVSGEGKNSLSIIRQRGRYWKLPRHPQSRSMLLCARRCSICRMGQTTPKVRAECLLKLADVIEENGQVFAELESRNCGKPLHSAFNDEIRRLSMFFAFSRVRALSEWSGGR